MSRMVDVVIASSFTLMVSIPGNHLDFALAAENAGADAIKTHINLYHHASGIHFKNWDEEKGSLIPIIANCNIPFGIVPGTGDILTMNEMIEIKNAGFDFWDLYFHHIPDWLFEFPDMGRMAAIDGSYDEKRISSISSYGIRVLESSIFPKDGYGLSLTDSDIEEVSKVAGAAGIPVLISTQRAICPEQVYDLKSAGIAGIIIGAVVTGNTVDSIAETTRAFRTAIDRM